MPTTIRHSVHNCVRLSGEALNALADALESALADVRRWAPDAPGQGDMLQAIGDIRGCAHDRVAWPGLGEVPDGTPLAPVLASARVIGHAIQRPGSIGEAERLSEAAHGLGIHLIPCELRGYNGMPVAGLTVAEDTKDADKAPTTVVTIVCPSMAAAVAVWSAAAAAACGHSVDGRAVAAIFPQTIAEAVRGYGGTWEDLPGAYALLALGEAACTAVRDDMPAQMPSVLRLEYGYGKSRVRLVEDVTGSVEGRTWGHYPAVRISGPAGSAFPSRVSAAMEMFYQHHLPTHTPLGHGSVRIDRGTGDEVVSDPTEIMSLVYATSVATTPTAASAPT